MWIPVMPCQIRLLKGEHNTIDVILEIMDQKKIYI